MISSIVVVGLSLSRRRILASSEMGRAREEHMANVVEFIRASRESASSRYRRTLTVCDDTANAVGMFWCPGCFAFVRIVDQRQRRGGYPLHFVDGLSNYRRRRRCSCPRTFMPARRVTDSWRRAPDRFTIRPFTRPKSRFPLKYVLHPRGSK